MKKPTITPSGAYLLLGEIVLWRGASEAEAQERARSIRQALNQGTERRLRSIRVVPEYELNESLKK